MRVVMAVDVGGTKVHAALISRSMERVADVAEPTVGRDPGLEAVLRSVQRIRTMRGDHTIVAVGAGFPEYVDPDGQLTSREVLDWSVQPIEALQRAAACTEVVVDSDVRLAARAEQRESGLDDFAYISVGTGLSSALVADGRVRVGARGEAIGLTEFPGPAGAATPSNLESWCSGSAIARRYSAANPSDPAPDARTVVGRALNGDSIATEVLTSAGEALAEGLAAVTALYDPGTIVLGGGLGSASTAMHDALYRRFADVTRRRPGAPAIVTATRGSDAGMYGAAYRAWERINR